MMLNRNIHLRIGTTRVISRNRTVLIHMSLTQHVVIITKAEHQQTENSKL